MPVFFQHCLFGSSLLVWKIEEEEVFFHSSLPADTLRVRPTHPARRLQSLAGRFLLKALSPDFPFDRWQVDESGRPFLENDPMYFSLSHTNSYAAAILHAKAPVGIDVEQISERVMRIQKKFIDESEALVLQALGEQFPDLSQSVFYTLAWSVKEAAYKALHQRGVDFINDLPILSIDANRQEYVVQMGGKGSGLHLQAWVMENVCLAAAVAH